MLRLFLLAFAVSLGAGYLALRWRHLHGRFSQDVAARGSHKVHYSGTPRIGGLAIFLGWTVGLVAAIYQGAISARDAAVWLACLIPAFGAGFLEDLTKQVSRSARLMACFVSAALAYALLDGAIVRIDVVFLDNLLAFAAVSFVFTCFAVGGVAHAINIIDGLNGLASGVCLIGLLALGYVAFHVGDSQLLLMCGLGAGALIGFRVWNFPSGRIFCGDGGAYFLGSYLAIISVLLVRRHAAVSAWFPLLLVLYPVWETVFSAYRRRILRGRPAMLADRLHLHTLFYKRVKLPLENGRTRTRRNSDASTFIILFAAGSAIPAVIWWYSGPHLLAAALCYILLYLIVYRRLVRFNAAPQRGRRTRGGYVAQRVAALQRAVSSRKSVREASKTR